MTSRNKGTDKELRVVELFAGVGGFRLGLCGTAKKPFKGYRIVWANQWEPSGRTQHAAMVYSERFHNGAKPNEYFNEDINKVVEIKNFPVPDHDLLVGGFPCQDYSVARTLSHAAGIEGKKGVLWWAIHKILQRRAPQYVMLENVDRLLKSPASQRGRDFGIILASLSDLGYAVEWRVVNAADYGMPQRRKRTFILGYKKGTSLYNKLTHAKPLDWLTKDGVVADAFPVRDFEVAFIPRFIEIEGSLDEVSKKFKFSFENSGLMFGRKFITTKTTPHDYETTTLGSILLPIEAVPKEFFISKSELAQWKRLKGSKKEIRSSKNGFTYTYAEGSMAFPDYLDRPSRTIVTGEGGPSPSRFKHVIKQGIHYRRLAPIELERLCMFPDNHTSYPGIGDAKRAFFMGNALVVGVIERLGQSLLKANKNL